MIPHAADWPLLTAPSEGIKRPPRLVRCLAFTHLERCWHSTPPCLRGLPSSTSTRQVLASTVSRQEAGVSCGPLSRLGQRPLWSTTFALFRTRPEPVSMAELCGLITSCRRSGPLPLHWKAKPSGPQRAQTPTNPLAFYPASTLALLQVSFQSGPEIKCVSENCFLQFCAFPGKTSPSERIHRHGCQDYARQYITQNPSSPQSRHVLLRCDL